MNFFNQPITTSIDIKQTSEVYPYPGIYSVTYDNDDYLHAMQTNQWRRNPQSYIPPPLMVRYEIKPMDKSTSQIKSVTLEQLSTNLLQAEDVEEEQQSNYADDEEEAEEASTTAAAEESGCCCCGCCVS